MPKVILCGFIYGLLTACSSPLPTYYYQLDAILKPLANVPAETSKPRIIGIGPTAIPTLLNRKAIVSKAADQTVQIATTQQWAEPLLESIPRVIARNLTALQPDNLFHVYPWSAFGAVDQRIVIEIVQFDAQLGKSVIFEVLWSIRDEQKQETLKQSRTRLEHPLKTTDYVEMVAAMNVLIGEFSQTLSKQLWELR